MTKMLVAALLGAAFVASSGSAFAAKKCNIVYPFTDSLGSTGKFTSEKKGTVSNSSICAKSYSLTVTKLTLTDIDITGKSKDKSCGALTGSFTFNNGGCDSATGTVTIVGLGTLPDTVTKSGSARHTPVDISALTKNLH
jgi:hypothetical protein